MTETGRTFPVDTLVEMAAIPADVLPRFLAELPGLLAEVRRVSGVANAFNQTFAGKLLMRPVEGIQWVDDDKREATVSVSMAGTDTVVTATRKLDA